MELELGLGIPGNDHGGLDLNIGIRKRDFEEAFEELATLPLFRLKDDEEDDGDSHQQQEKPVGWPPIKYTRREVAVRRRGTCVKVKMEGMVIGRKVDLSLHRSYHHLFETLNDMFPKAHHPTVTYEDGEGDWMLVGDVPWEAFIKSAKRLKILS